jgi:hypothetical protein
MANADRLTAGGNRCSLVLCDAVGADSQHGGATVFGDLIRPV